MKHKLQTLLKHKLQWLLLLAALLGVSQGVWAWSNISVKGSWDSYASHNVGGTTYSVTLTAGTYCFKLYSTDDSGTWFGNNGTMTANYGDTFTWSFYKGTTTGGCDNEGKCTLVVNAAGKYTFRSNSYGGADPQITVTAPPCTAYDVYFDNKDTKWSTPYIRFYSSEYWNSTNGSGSKGRDNATAMTLVSGTIYKATNSNCRSIVVFTKDAQNDYENFYNTKAVYSDGNSSHGPVGTATVSSSTPLFTPNTSSSQTKNGTTYYGGTWSAYSPCTTPSASDISITDPSAKTIIYTGTGNAPSTSAQTISATCSKGDTYLWSANHSGYSYTCAFKPSSGTSTNHSIEKSGSKSTTITFYHEGVYTANFAAGCGNTSGGNKNSKTFVVRPGYMYIAGTLLDNSWTFSDSRRVAINKSDSTFTYVWDASYTTGQFLASVNNYCLTTASASYTISNYAELTLNNITKDTDGNHNLNPNVGTINLGDKLKLKIEYKGVNSSGIPKYTLTLNKVPVPTTTNAPAAKSYTTATLTGTYPTTSGYCSISEKGICYGADTNPTDKHVDSSSSSGSISMDITGLTPGETYHYRAYVVVDGETYYGADKSFTTTACTAPEITTQPYDTQTRRYCINTDTPTTLTVVATGGVDSYTYQWQERLKDKSTFSNVTTGTGYQTASFTPSNASAGNRYYRCIVTNESVCTSYSATSNESCLYTINRLSDAGTISGDGTYCQGASGDTQTLTLTDYVGSRQWHKSTTSDFTPTNDTKISGATGTTYNAPINTTGTMYYKVVVTNGACQSATSATAAEVTVRPNMSVDGVTLNLSSASVCNGATGVTASISGTPVTTEAGGVGQYQSSNTSVATINTSTGAITTVSAGNTDITYKVTGGCGSDVETTAATLTVKAVPTITSSTSTVTSYVPVSISSNANVTWSRTPDNTNSYLYETTSTAAKFKGNNTSSPYSVRGVAENGCEGSTTITVTQDTETCTQ